MRLFQSVNKTGLTSLPKKYLIAKQGGAVAIIVALALPILIGAGGLALDLGKLFITKTELQNAVDACALSAARELNGTAAQFAAAETAGRDVGQLNTAYFQRDAVVLPVDDAVTFSQTLGGTYETKAALTGLTPAQAANYKFVKCTASKGDIANFLIQVLNVMPGIDGMDEPRTVAAAAVATLSPSQSTCAIPVGLCTSDVTGTTAKGTWLSGVVGPEAGGNSKQVGDVDGVEKPGAFKWIDFTPNAGGANEVKDLLEGEDCADPLPSEGADVNEPGFNGSARAAYNTRFGLKHGGGNPNAPIPTPDRTGFSYYGDPVTIKVQGVDTVVPPTWPSKANAYPDYLAKVKGTEYQDNDPFKGLETGIELAGGTEKVSLANGRNRRVVVAPVVDCATLTLSSYACIFLLHPLPTKGPLKEFNMFLEYLGDANEAGPCNQSGLPGSSTSVGPATPALVQ